MPSPAGNALHRIARLSPFAPAPVALLAALLCSGCGGGPAVWTPSAAAISAQRPGFPVAERLRYLHEHPGLSNEMKEAVLGGKLIPGMTAEEVVRIAGEPQRRLEMPAEAAGEEPTEAPRSGEEWVYQRWTLVSDGVYAPAIVYVSGGVVVGFVAIGPSPGN